MKIIFLGSGEFGIPCLDALRKSGHKLAMVLTQSPHPAGRGRKIHPTPSALWAKANSIPCIETENVNSPEIIATIAQCKPDVAVVIAFGQKIRQRTYQFARERHYKRSFVAVAEVPRGGTYKLGDNQRRHANRNYHFFAC